ncbi:3-oxoacyl-[acyl-carrier-protein] synthase III C-terminal domain-containing protein [Actinoplanes sp. RD1]|uniref:3-oxoacyl-[acyl-carrier-protein] synthase III C-terminal domain-containing protein n=1 Tax=Actinoplanes sp. RD1 TaxID=3064538 RepID=UPI002740CC6F|nr:3-oxoacyl-[acyl-carrier-protein] synthase III C-terminal domain-containing protein [Actinoplanes sp. RD1]
MTIGIGSIHCVVPADRVAVGDLPELGGLTAEEAAFVSGTGIGHVAVLPDAPTTDYAIQACQELGKLTDVDPDVLISVGYRAPDVLLGSDVGRIQAEGGYERAFAFTLDGLGCTGSSVAWGIGRDLLLADPARQSVLIAHASRPAGADRVRFPVTVIGDGAYAMTLVRGGRPALVAHRQETDGTFHDLFRVDYRQAPWYEWREECDSPDRYRFELAMHSKVRLARMVTEALAEAGIGREQVAATLMQNVTAGAYGFYETLLGLPIHPVCREQLTAYGHLGAMDVVLNLDRLLASGELRPGDHVLMLNNSPVAAWAVTVWQV